MALLVSRRRVDQSQRRCRVRIRDFCRCMVKRSGGSSGPTTSTLARWAETRMRRRRRLLQQQDLCGDFSSPHLLCKAFFSESPNSSVLVWVFELSLPRKQPHTDLFLLYQLGICKYIPTGHQSISHSLGSSSPANRLPGPLARHLHFLCSCTDFPQRSLPILQSVAF